MTGGVTARVTPHVTMAAMRVMIAEDSAVLREGLAGLLTERGFEVVAAVPDAAALRAAVEADVPDVAVVDIRMPPTHTDEGLRAAIDLRQRFPALAVLVFSQYVETRYAAELLAERSDGVGYLLKDRVAHVNEFVAAVERVAAGGTADTQNVEDHQHHAKGDCRIGDIEDVEGIGLPVKVEEVGNGAIEDAVEAIGEGAADAAGEAGAQQQPVGPPPPDREGADGGENHQPEHPERHAAEEAVGDAGVPDEDVVEVVGDGDKLAAAPARDLDLEVLVAAVEGEGEEPEDEAGPDRWFHRPPSSGASRHLLP